MSSSASARSLSVISAPLTLATTGVGSPGALSSAPGRRMRHAERERRQARRETGDA